MSGGGRRDENEVPVMPISYKIVLDENTAMWRQ